MSAQAAVVEVGVDYLTTTTADAERRKVAWERAKALEGTLCRLGAKPHPWRWQGYEGYIAGPLSYGWRSDGVIVRLSGPWADARFDAFAMAADNCSRVDLQVTAAFPDLRRDLASESWEAVKAEADKRGRHLGSSVILNDQGGQTLYIGSRQSELFGRLYDKWRESNDPRYQNAWRWEVETKHGQASAAMAGLLDSPNPRTAILATVGRYFGQRGIPPDWEYPADGALRPPKAPLSDDERRLLWLQNQVSPVVGGLINRVPRAAVLTALGLVKGHGVQYRARLEQDPAWVYGNDVAAICAAKDA